MRTKRAARWRTAIPVGGDSARAARWSDAPLAWRFGFSFRPRSQTALSPFDPRFARISTMLRMTRTKGSGGRIVELARMKNNPPPALREPPASCRRQVTCSALPRTVCYKGAIQRVQTKHAARWRTAIPVGTDVPGGPPVWRNTARCYIWCVRTH